MPSPLRDMGILTERLPPGQSPAAHRGPAPNIAMHPALLPEPLLGAAQPACHSRSDKNYMTRSRDSQT